MSMRSLNTIGYEGASLEDLIGTLVAAEVTFLIDVRERAQSRRRGFSKTALSERLEQEGIKYLHLRQLGDPKNGREAARSGDMAEFRRIYRGVLATAASRDALEAIADATRVDSVCLLCYERAFEDCHRKMISDKIESRTGRKTRHLGVKRFEQAANRTR